MTAETRHETEAAEAVRRRLAEGELLTGELLAEAEELLTEAAARRTWAAESGRRRGRVALREAETAETAELAEGRRRIGAAALRAARRHRAEAEELTAAAAAARRVRHGDTPPEGETWAIGEPAEQLLAAAAALGPARTAAALRSLLAETAAAEAELLAELGETAEAARRERLAAELLAELAAGETAAYLRPEAAAALREAAGETAAALRRYRVSGEARLAETLASLSTAAEELAAAAAALS